jgi:hypothetical protein
VGPGRLGQIVDATRAFAQVIGDAQLGDDVDRTRDIVARDHPEEGEGWRNLLRGHSKDPSFVQVPEVSMPVVAGSVLAKCYQNNARHRLAAGAGIIG